ncbi:MAG TPA: arginase [Pyrinomonadaceae bacterium]|jgi:arginase|nr:arginase [Pyrinomonadaceae bacterium]
MSALSDQTKSSLINLPPGDGRRVSIIGVPLSFGAGTAGVDLGPAAMRVARLNQRLALLGYEVRDLGDMRLERPTHIAAPQDKAKYMREISIACEELAAEVERVMRAGEFPIVLGGDHSIAAGSIAGAASVMHEQQKQIGLIWFDAHADMNTPETSLSGHVHGMPLAALLGYGAPEMTHIAGFSPKLDPRYCAHIGARDLDPAERDLIRELGIRFFTMREIDERGMSVCIDEAIEIAKGATGGYYVTLDVDALDPVVAPGSGTVVRGGLTYRESHLALEKIAEAGGMIAFEVVEINTALDINNRTAELGVELILSAMGKTIL